MNKRSSRYDPNTETSRLLALDGTRYLCNNSEELMACARGHGSYALFRKIKNVIDDYAEREMEHREYWGRPHNAGASTPEISYGSNEIRSSSP